MLQIDLLLSWYTSKKNPPILPPCKPDWKGTDTSSQKTHRKAYTECNLVCNSETGSRCWTSSSRGSRYSPRRILRRPGWSKDCRNISSYRHSGLLARGQSRSWNPWSQNCSHVTMKTTSPRVHSRDSFWEVELTGVVVVRTVSVTVSFGSSTLLTDPAGATRVLFASCPIVVSG